MKIQQLQLIFFIILLTFFVKLQYSSATDFYISPTGNDHNSGTKEHPFQTIKYAQKAVGEIINKGLTENITVYIKGGVYRIKEPLVFEIQDSGNEQFSITYSAFENEIPIISGGKAIDGWKQRKDGLWQVNIADNELNLRELFVNGKRAIRAQHPNKGYFRIVKPSEDRMSYFSFKEEDIPDDVKVAGLELVFIHDWSISRIPVTKIDFHDNLLYPLSKIGRQHFMMVIDGYEKHPRYFLENAPQFCDAPGEWCFISDNTIIYYPRPGESIEQIEAVFPVAEQLLKVNGDSDNNLPLQNLHFKGIVFEHCAYNFPKNGYGGVQATFHTNDEWQGMGNHVTPAVEFNNVIRCSFEDCIIHHVDGAGISFGRNCSNCLLTGSIISDIGGNGIMIGEGRSNIRGEEQWWINSPEQASNSIIIKNNLIENCGHEYFGAVGIWVGFANEISITHNEIRNLPYTGISVGWMWNPRSTPCKANTVSNNHIHHVMQILSDGGGIYTLGLQPGTVLKENYIHDVPINLGRAESNGMFLDEGTTDIKIEQNVIHNTDRSPLRFHKAGKNLVRENILTVKQSIPHIRYNNTKEENIKQVNNTIINSDTDSIYQLSDKTSKILESVGIEEPYRNKLLKQK